VVEVGRGGWGSGGGGGVQYNVFHVNTPRRERKREKREVEGLGVFWGRDNGIKR